MITCLGKSCSIGLLCVSFVNVYHFCVCPSFPFVFEGGMWDLIVLIPDHCHSIYFSFAPFFRWCFSHTRYLRLCSVL